MLEIRSMMLRYAVAGCVLLVSPRPAGGQVVDGDTLRSVGLAAGPGSLLTRAVSAAGLAAGGAVLGTMVAGHREHWQLVELPARPAMALARLADRGTLSPGDTVKLYSPSRELVHGVFASSDSVAIEVESLDGRESIAFPRTIIARAEVLRGRHRRGLGAVGRGAIIGGVVAGASVAVLLVAEGGDDEGLGPLLVLASSLFGSAVGAGAGAFAALGQADHWVRVDPRTLSLMEQT